MAFDGKWNIEIASPMGAQKAVCDFKVDGGKLTGTQSGDQGSVPIDGSVEGASAKFSASVTSPMPMKLEFDIVEDGDTFSGKVKAGAFGVFNVKGARA